MKRFAILLALVTCLFASTAEARRGCANGSCSQPSGKAGVFATANLTPAKFDTTKHPRDPVTGQFIPAPKAAAVESDDHRDYGRQPVRKAGKAVLRGAGRVLLAPVRLLRRGRCG